MKWVVTFTDISSLGYKSSLSYPVQRPSVPTTSSSDHHNDQTLKSLQKHYMNAITSLNPHQHNTVMTAQMWALQSLSVQLRIYVELKTVKLFLEWSILSILCGDFYISLTLKATSEHAPVTEDGDKKVLITKENISLHTYIFSLPSWLMTFWR